MKRFLLYYITDYSRLITMGLISGMGFLLACAMSHPLDGLLFLLGFWLTNPFSYYFISYKKELQCRSDKEKLGEIRHLIKLYNDALQKIKRQIDDL